MLTCKIVRKNRALLIDVNGREIFPFLYVTYNPAGGLYGPFGAAGVKVVSTAVYLGDRGINNLSGIRPFRPAAWLGPDQFDFSAVEEDFRRIIEAIPDALILPRIYFDVPTWWDRLHPDQTSRDFAGTPIRQSFASRIWLEDCRGALEAFYCWLSANSWEDRLIGCQVAAGSTEEWFHHQAYAGQLLDYSEINRQGFAAWLSRRYGQDICRLNASWHKTPSLSGFADVVLPTPAERLQALDGDSRDPMREMAVLDFYRYHSAVIAGAIRELCGMVKSVSRGRHLAGAFYGYALEIMSPDMGAHALAGLLDDPQVDFLASPSSYMKSRAVGIDWPFMGPVETVMRHDKLWFVEADVRTCLTRFMKETMPFAATDNPVYENAVWQGPATLPQSLGVMAKVFARCLTGNTALWWFDMWGGWYDDPAIMELVGQSGRLYAEVMSRGGCQPAAEIAVVVSEEAYARFRRGCPVMHRAVYEQRYELGFLGAPYHTYLLEDLANVPVDPYKLVFFLNTTHLTADQLELIRQRFYNSRRTIVWCGLDQAPELPGPTGFAGSRRAADADAGDTAQSAGPAVAGRVYTLDGQEGGVPLSMQVAADHTQVLSPVPGLPAARLRELAIMAGVHIYCHSGEVIYASREFIAIHAATAGVKRIYLPETGDAEWVIGSGKPLRNVPYFDISLEKGETALWQIRLLSDIDK